MGKKNRLFWLIGSLGLIFDQLTKFWIVQNLYQEGNTIPVVSDVFHLTYIVNTGAAFSLFPGGVLWLRWLSLAVSLGLIAYGIFGSRMRRIEQFGYGFILAGALGNGWDRFLFGYVVDFLQFPGIYIPAFSFKPLEFYWMQFPVFNFADVFINLGVVFLIIANFPAQSVAHRRN